MRRANATSVGEFFLRHDVPGNKDARRVLTPAREDSGLFYFVFTPATGTSARARLTRAGGGGGAQGDGAESGDAGPVSAPSAGGFWAGVSAPNAGGWPRMPGDGPARRGPPLKFFFNNKKKRRKRPVGPETRGAPPGRLGDDIRTGANIGPKLAELWPENGLKSAASFRHFICRAPPALKLSPQSLPGLPPDPPAPEKNTGG